MIPIPAIPAIVVTFVKVYGFFHGVGVLTGGRDPIGDIMIIGNAIE